MKPHPPVTSALIANAVIPNFGERGALVPGKATSDPLWIGQTERLHPLGWDLMVQCRCKQPHSGSLGSSRT